MKKKVQLLLLLTIALLGCAILVINGKQKLQLELSGDGNLSILLTSDYNHQRIYPWYLKSDERYYFFLPSYCKSNNIRFKDVKEDRNILIDGVPIRSGSKFEWQEENEYQLEIRTDSAVVSYNVIFLRSENLPTIFIETDSGNMDYIHADKNNEEMGNMNIITEEGTVEYSGRLKKISGRGNSTWNGAKKPYAIKLTGDRALLGMDASDKWCLIAGLYEGAKMNNKAAFDIAELLGLDYSPQCTWTDLYLNGEYAGIYLLSGTVSVGQGRVNITDLEKQNKANNPDIDGADIFKENAMKGYIVNNGANISGGYLFEKAVAEQWAAVDAGFITLQGNQFIINSPKHASREQVEYLSGYVQDIEDILNESDVEYANYIDYESFARKFIVDEIALNFDGNVTSMFYYKEANNDLLYAGPVWDFDGGFGHIWSNYDFSLLDSPREVLDWYTKLYNDEAFKTRVIEIYSDALPRMEELVETKIDIYADYIRKSVELDTIRWGNVDAKYPKDPGHYVEFDNNVRYLKFYLANRLNYLSERWDVDHRELPLPTVEGTHEITFWLDEELIETRVVADGDVLEQLPYLDEDVFEGWCFTYSDEIYWAYLPIYEDVAFYAKRK